MQPAAVIWDVDGTLVDTAELHFAAWVRLAKEMGRPFTRDDFTATFGRRNPEIIRFLFGEHYTEAEIAEIGERKEGYYRTAAQAGVDLLTGVRTLLEAFQIRGVLQAIGSSAPRQPRSHPSAHRYEAILPSGRGDGRHPARQARSGSLSERCGNARSAAWPVHCVRRRGSRSRGGPGGRNEVRGGTIRGAPLKRENASGGCKPHRGYARTSQSG